MNEIMKNCCACDIDKPVSSFYKNNNLRMGYDAKCKLCRRTGMLCRKANNKEKPEPVRKKEYPYITSPTQDDWIETFSFLKDIGYELRDDLSIHEQFCIKYNLTPRKKVYDAKTRFTPKQLGLI
jgi:hypothetical protein